MQPTSFQFLRAAGVLTSTALVLASAQLSAAEKSDAFPTFDSYIKVSGQAASIRGDSAAFQSRTGQSEFRDGAGIEDLHYIHDLNKSTALTIDGRALTGSEDYLLDLKLVKDEVGSVNVGYKRFRTFYDGVGGFFPGNSAFSRLNPENLFVDRGEFWAEVKLARPEQPEVTIRYTNGTRSGKKDSTIWGDSDNTGIAYGTGAATPTRKNAPSYLDIDERHETLEGTVKHTLGNTTAQLTLLGDWTGKDNSRYVERYPGEVRVANAAGTGVTPVVGSTAWTTFNNESDITTFDQQDTTTKGVNGKTVTVFGPKLTLRIAAGAHDTSGSIGGDRILVTSQPITGDPTRMLTTYNVKDLIGESAAKTYAGSVAVDYDIREDLTVSLGLRKEAKNTNAQAQYDVVTTTTVLVPVTTTTKRREVTSADETSSTPVLDLRYAGIKTLALYANVSHKYGDADEYQTPAYNPATLAAGVAPRRLYRNIDEASTDYTIGANWKAASALTLRGEAFYKGHRFQGRGTDTSAPTPPALPVVTPINFELDSQFWGVRLSAIVKPLDTLTSTTRYVWQRGQRQVTGSAFTEYDAMDSTTYTIGQTFDWNPVSQFYMQAGADVVFNFMSTAYPLAGNPANTVLQDSHNDYITVSLLAGMVLTKRDDVQVKFTYYRAYNGNPELTNTQPYGVSVTEFTATVGLIHKVSDRLMASAKVGYFESHNDTTGGNTDYHGPMAYVSLDYGL